MDTQIFDIRVKKEMDDSSKVERRPLFSSEADEIKFWIMQRGQSSTPRKGRPTHFKPGASSGSPTQEDARSAEATALEAAGGSDRQAKAQLMKRVKAEEGFADLAKHDQDHKINRAVEDMQQQRFENQQSKEWLQSKLTDVHQKWNKKRKAKDEEEVEEAMQDVRNKRPKHEGTQTGVYAAKRLYGKGGVVEKLYRRVFAEGASKLKVEDGSEEGANEEFKAFVRGLEPEELAMIQDENWQEREPTPPPEYGDVNSTRELQATKDFTVGENDDECEEEVSDDEDEMEALIAQMPDEWENDEDSSVDDEDEPDMEDDMDEDADDE